MLKEFFAYYRPHQKLFWLDFGSAVMSGMLELAFPLAITWFIDSLLPMGDWSLTVAAGIALLGVYLFNTALMGIVTYWGHMLGIEIETEMRTRAFAHLTRMSWGWYDQARTGKLVARVTRDLEDIGEIAHHGPEDVMIAIMTFVGALILMVMLHPTLALITALIAPLTIWLVVVFGTRITKNWQEIYARVGNFNVRLEEAIGGIRVVQSFANEAHERKLFDADNRGYRKTKLQAYRLMAVSSSIHYMGMRLVQVVVMVIGAGFVLNGSLSTGGFVGFLLLVNVFFRPLEKIAAVMELYPRGIAGFYRYQELLDTKPDIVDAPHSRKATTLTGAIDFDDVSFGYTPDRPVLRNISLRIAAGETVAFVGASGAGKSTLLALLPRFYDPTSGEIRIDGTRLADMTLESYRKQIGIVGQDVFLFGSTLRENIAYGRLDASEHDIMRAIERAQLRDIVNTMPDGLDTMIGERGVMLSGGQRQRIAIARAFLRNPPILILDEATSALDSETERDIQAALEELSVGRTTLVIAHRLSTIRNADRIVVMRDGEIHEIGTHDTLISRGGIYANLASVGQINGA